MHRRGRASSLGQHDGLPTDRAGWMVDRPRRVWPLLSADRLLPTSGRREAAPSTHLSRRTEAGTREMTLVPGWSHYEACSGDSRCHRCRATAKAFDRLYPAPRLLSSQQRRIGRLRFLLPAAMADLRDALDIEMNTNAYTQLLRDLRLMGAVPIGGVWSVMCRTSR